MNVGVVIVCAGTGKRLGKQDKAVLRLDGMPLFYHSVNTFKKIKTVNQIVLVLKKKNFSPARKLINDKRVILVSGGKERKDSVYNGLRALSEDIEYVLVHDGARPFVDKGVILRVLGALKTNNSVICGIPAVDTLKYTDGSYVNHTLDRAKIVCAQTPQGFKKGLLLEAYAKLGKNKVFDDAQAVEYLGGKVKVVKGDRGNIKITYPEDRRSRGRPMCRPDTKNILTSTNNG